MHPWARKPPRRPKTQVSEEARQNKGRGLNDRKLTTSDFIAGRPKDFCFGTSVVLDVVCEYLFSSYYI